MTTNNAINNTLGAATASSLAFSPSTSGNIGTTTNNNASTGIVGEFISSVLSSGSAIPLVSGTAADVTSISLTAGDWNVWGNIGCHTTVSAGLNIQRGWVSSTSATAPDDSLVAMYDTTGGSGFTSYGSPVPGLRFSLSTTTTIYLSVKATITAGSGTAYGGIYARRIR